MIYPRLTWARVITTLQQYEPRTTARVEKGHLPHPLAAGMKSSIGMPEGQTADYRLVLQGGAGLHVKDFGTHYEAHIDEVHPDVNAIEHMRRDAPGMFVASGAALGAVIGKSVGSSKDATIVGAVLGAAFAALLASANND
jgi:hypothetical protein